MDAQYKELQSRAKQPTPDLDDDDIPMSREEEAKFMQTFRKTRFYNDYRDRDSNRDNWRSSGRNDYNRDNYRSNTDDKSYDLQRQFNDFMKSQQSTNAFVKDTFMDLKTQLETVAKNHQASIQNLETKFDRLADKQSGRPSGSLPSNTQPNPRGDLDNSTSNVLIPLDSWTSGLLVYKLPLSVEYGVSTSIGYGVSSFLSNTAYSSQQINTAYPLPLDTTYRSSRTEAKIFDFRAKIFPFFETNPTDCLSLVSGQFLKELRENTFSGSNNEDANEHIEKVLEIVDLFHVPNIIVDQLMLQVFPISLTGAASRWLRNEPTEVPFQLRLLKMLKRPSKKWLNTLKNGIMKHLEEDSPEILTDGAIQAPTEHLGSTPSGIPLRCDIFGGVTVDLFKEGDIEQQLLDAAIRNQGPSIKTLEIQIGQMSKVLQEKGFGSLPSSTETNSRDQVKSISTTIEADSHSIRRIGSSQYAVSTGQHNFIILDMPEDIKVPLIHGRPFLSTARAKIDVYKRKITLRVEEERIVFTSVKPASSLIKRVDMLSLRERMKLDLEARLMGETLVLNRSLDPFLEDYIELNDLNEPFELRRNQGDDLIPTIEEGKVLIPNLDRFLTL
ncbi:hypothetical protein Tco_0972660 [Tanacetum coccineum]